ncbi:hypothetical protein BST61_g5574 [Cercospora zeina]
MGSISDAPPSQQATIPIIDFSRWTHPRTAQEQAAVAKDLISACESMGFVYITSHGLSQNLLDEAFATSKRLFDLPHSEKMKAPHPDEPDVHRGYSYPGLEKVSQYSGGDEAEGEKLREVVDVKESYEVGSEDNKLQPNVWLPESSLANFRSFSTSFYWSCNSIAQEILRCIAAGLDLPDEDFFVRYCSGHNNQLRLLHYPPIPASDIETGRAARISSHSDWGVVTLLFHDDCGGLEVEHPHKPGIYMPATPLKNACVMNVGDLLMRWTNDMLKSTLHRVTLPPLADRYSVGEGEQRMTRARYSIPYFVSADPEAVISCLPECTTAERPANYEPVTQAEYGRRRAKVQYRSNPAT